MSAARVIVALYPPAVRQRWGDELAGAVVDGGVRGWPDAVGGAVHLWLHPSDWPETAVGQTRRVLAVALFAVAAAAMLLLRADQPAGGPVAAGLWFGPMAAGALLAAPLPRWSGLRRMCAEGVRCMAAPAVAVAVIFVLARSGVGQHVALVAYYWATLTFFAVRACTLVARVLPVCGVPSARRLRAALLLVGAGTTVAAGEGVLAGALAVTAGLGILATVSLRAGLDLGR